MVSRKRALVSATRPSVAKTRQEAPSRQQNAVGAERMRPTVQIL
ncbi:hypothetical protein [Chelatococcus sp.]|nr:hypothetical protein [Chelatococcus sp.]